MGEHGVIEHDFNTSLALSHAAEDMPFWEEVYHKAFPAMIAMLNHRADGDHQRQGIDRSVILSNSKQVLVDEKVRGRNQKTGIVYGDILLEYWSDEDRRVPGWVCKPLLADYIAYAIAPQGKCYLLPVLQLQEAWRRHRDRWIANGPEIRSYNNTGGRRWTTVSTAVAPQELFKHIGECLRIDFQQCEFSD